MAKRKKTENQNTGSLQPQIGFNEIAEACGVSAMTVSRAMRPGASVSEATRTRILETAEKLGYQINTRQGRPRKELSGPRPVVDVLIGISISPRSMFSSQLLVAIEQALDRHGYDCVVRYCDSGYAAFVSLCNALRLSRAENFLVVGYFPIEQLETILTTVPRAVLVDHSGDPRLEHPCESVAIDYVEAARQAVRHLIRQGRRKIVLLKGDTDHYFTRDITRGFNEVLGMNGIEIIPDLLLEADFTAKGANEVIRKALGRGLDFDAVFTNDEMGVGVLRALFDAGKSVPKDVAIVGCDALPLGEQTIPSLTSVVVDINNLAEIAVQRVLTPASAAKDVQSVRLVPSLVIRESTQTGI
jgi:LacI family transcriptional regulator